MFQLRGVFQKIWQEYILASKWRIQDFSQESIAHVGCVKPIFLPKFPNNWIRRGVRFKLLSSRSSFQLEDEFRIPLNLNSEVSNCKISLFSSRYFMQIDVFAVGHLWIKVRRCLETRPRAGNSTSNWGVQNPRRETVVDVGGSEIYLDSMGFSEKWSKHRVGAHLGRIGPPMGNPRSATEEYGILQW